MQKLIFMITLLIYEIAISRIALRHPNNKNLDLIIGLIPIAICIIGALG